MPLYEIYDTKVVSSRLLLVLAYAQFGKSIGFFPFSETGENQGKNIQEIKTTKSFNLGLLATLGENGMSQSTRQLVAFVNDYFFLISGSG